MAIFKGALNCWRKSDSGNPQRRQDTSTMVALLSSDAPIFQMVGWKKHQPKNIGKNVVLPLPLENIPQLIVSP